MCAIEMTSDGMIHIYMPSFMKISIGVQVILIFFRDIYEAEMLVLLMGGIYDVSH
jgi:hypothetical protein